MLDRVTGTRGAAAGTGSEGNPAAQLLDRFTGTRGAGAATGSDAAPAATIPRDLRGLEDEALRRLLPTRRNARAR